MKDETPPLQIDWLKTVGGALAAVTTAVLLSTLGAAGTLIGAAVGSIAVTLSTQVYTQGLARSRAGMAKAQETALSKVGIAQSEVRRAGRGRAESGARDPRGGPAEIETDEHLERADEHLSAARADLGDPASASEPPESLQERLRMLPWKRIGLLTAAMFVVVVLLIGAFEQLSGRSVASYTGGSDRESGSIVPGGADQDERAPGEDQDRRNGDDDDPGDDPTAQDPDGSDDTDPSDPADPDEGATPTPAPTAGEPTSTPSTPSAPASPASPTPTSPASPTPTSPAPSTAPR